LTALVCTRTMGLTEDDTILVTGATGFIATHVVDQLLKDVYHVRGTARSLDSVKTSYLKKTFSKYGDQLELVEVTDLEAPGVFDIVRFYPMCG
jgi:nucleoside-diphosphate-sugar epimerase